MRNVLALLVLCSLVSVGTGDDEATRLKRTIKTVNKAKSIIIPEIDFRQAHLRDVIDTLSEMSADNDPNRMSKGINIILMLPDQKRAEDNDVPIVEDDPFSDDPFREEPEKDSEADEEKEADKEKMLPLISFKARQLSLYEALKIVCRLSDMKLRPDGNIFYIEKDGDTNEAIIKKTYNIDPSAAAKLKRIQQDMRKLKPRLRKGF